MTDLTNEVIISIWPSISYKETIFHDCIISLLTKLIIMVTEVVRP